jgi:hypothetical protein
MDHLPACSVDCHSPPTATYPCNQSSPQLHAHMYLTHNCPFFRASTGVARNTTARPTTSEQLTATTIHTLLTEPVRKSEPTAGLLWGVVTFHWLLSNHEAQYTASSPNRIVVLSGEGCQSFKKRWKLYVPLGINIHELYR